MTATSGGRGAFISLEGIEGAGKSTAIAEVHAELAARGLTGVTTREPGGTALAERLRELLLARSEDESLLPETEVLLMFAARAQHLAGVIRPTLARGDWVVCDRFTDATLAYQGAGRQLGERMIRQLARWLHDDVWPDLTLLLDIDEDTGRARASQCGEPDRFEVEQSAFFARARCAYRELAAAEPGRFRVIDASRPQAEVATAVRTVVAQFCAAWELRR